MTTYGRDSSVDFLPMLLVTLPGGGLLSGLWWTLTPGQ